MNRKMILFIAAGVLAALYSSSLAAASEDAAAILEKIKNKYASFANDVNDLSISEEMEMKTLETTITQRSDFFKKGDKFRVNSTVKMPNQAVPAAAGSLESIVIADGRDVWMISPLLGKQKIPMEQAAQAASHADYWDFFNKNTKVLTTDSVEGRPCYVLETENAGRGPMKVWVDKERLVPLQTEFQTDKGPARAVYSDFRKIKGDWEMPYLVRMYWSGSLLSTMKVQSVKVNTGLSDTLFNPDTVEVKGSTALTALLQKMKQAGVGTNSH